MSAYNYYSPVANCKVEWFSNFGQKHPPISFITSTLFMIFELGEYAIYASCWRYIQHIYDAKMAFYLCSFARIHIFTNLSTLVVLVFRHIFRILYETYESSFQFLYFLVWMLIQSLIAGQIYTLVIVMKLILLGKVFGVEGGYPRGGN